MTAIFTGFTPATQACRPIANPLPAFDLSELITPLSISVLGAPSAITSEAAQDVTLPSVATAQPVYVVPMPDTIAGIPAYLVSTPSAASAIASYVVTNPVAINPETASALELPAAVTALTPSNLDNPSALAWQNRGSNLFVYSEQIDNGAWGKTELVVTPNAAIAPDGTLTADRLTDTAANNLHRAFQTVTGQTAGDKATVSLYAKAESLSKLELPQSISGADMPSSAVFDLTARSVSGGDNSRIVDAGDGWYRCSATYTVNTTGAVTPQILLVKGNQSIYAGSGESLLLWGAQFEKASTVNTYVKTEASVVSFVPAVGLPLVISSESQPSLDLPVTVGAIAQPSLDLPSAASTVSQPTYDAPSAVTSVAQPVVEAPTSISSQGIPTVATPSALTPNAGTKTTPPFALHHPRILYENILRNYSTVNDSLGTGTGINALKYDTGMKWKFSAAANTLIVDLGTNEVAFDTVCIGAHNLGSAGATVGIYYEPEPGGVLVELETLNPTDNAHICSYSETLLGALTVEIRISGASGVPQIGYISAGQSLQMQRPIFDGHTPITDADVTNYYANRSESGEILGQDIRSQGYETSADFSNIDDTWYRTYFKPFKQAAKTRPFFFMWNLDEYPEDVGFCRIEQDIRAPMRRGFNITRDVSFTLLGAG